MTGTSGACRESASAITSRSRPSSTTPRSRSRTGEHQVVEPGALGQPAGDPDDRVVGLQRGLGGVRVGGLGVVDPGDAVALAPRPRSGGRRAGRPAARRGPRPGRRRASGPARPRPGRWRRSAAPGEARSAIVQSSAALVSRCSMKARSARMSSTRPTMPDAGHAEGEADRAGALDHVGLADQPLGLGVGDVVDAGALHALVDPALVGGVVGHPVGPAYQSRWSSATLSTAADCGAHRVGVVQLEAGQLDGEHVVRLGVHHRLDDRQPDVADGDAAQAGGPQDRVEHLHGRGLAVGAGHAQPRACRGRGSRSRQASSTSPQTGMPRARRLGEQRRGRAASRAR